MMRMLAIARLQSSGNKTVATTARPSFAQRIGVFLGLVGVALPAIALAGSLRLVSPPSDAARTLAEKILGGITKKDASLVV